MIILYISFFFWLIQRGRRKSSYLYDDVFGSLDTDSNDNYTKNTVEDKNMSDASKPIIDDLDNLPKVSAHKGWSWVSIHSLVLC